MTHQPAMQNRIMGPFPCFQPPMNLCVIMAALFTTMMLPSFADAAWVPVAYDMVASGNQNLISHSNPWVDAFSSSDDGFEKYTRGVSSSVPPVLLDDTNNPGYTGPDTIGIVDFVDQDEFFGIADTENNQNAGPVTASWDFDVAGYTIAAIQIDAAAMGDFEETGSQRDWFRWQASLDGGAQTVVFDGSADGSLTYSYTLADGSVVELMDPMTINQQVLSNQFTTFTSLYHGAGNVLTLELEAYASGSDEATAFKSIKILADDGGPTPSPTVSETCPEEYCSGEVPSTIDPATEACNLSAVTLATSMYQGNVLVQMLGPANPADAAAIVLSSPHGGYLQPNFIPLRTTNNPTYCPSDGCEITRDTYTKELTLSIQQHIIDNYCKVPYVIINQLHRNRLDANREIGEAAFGNSIAEAAWLDYHSFISDAQLLIKSTYGTVNSASGLTGVVGLLLDVHGYSGQDWVATNGSPFIQWGYQLGTEKLAQCPADRFSGIYPDDDTFSHAASIQNKSLECLIRGPAALGSRVVPPVGGVDSTCGYGLPSYQYPDPSVLANDCAHCHDMCSSTPSPCHFYTGGYDVQVHEYVDWQSATGDLFNTVQAEFPRCIRFNSTMRDLIADSVSQAMYGFLHDLFGPEHFDV